MSVRVGSAEPTVGSVGHVGSQSTAITPDLGPWPIFRVHTRSIVTAVVTCLVVLVSLELAVFRSGFFAAHVTVSDPQWPAVKLAIAERQSDARVLYVGDSTMMTSVLPTIVSRSCECGPGFNGGFSAANPWLTDAWTRHLLTLMRPTLVVISMSPWTFDSAAHFANTDLARQVMSPDELAARGAPVDLQQSIDAGLGRIWSAYGQRALVKEWFSSLAPSQRYDESLRGYYVAPGSANSEARLVATADRLFADVGTASASAPGALVIRSLVDDLRARGIAVAFLLPPLHPAAYDEAGAFLEHADAAVAALAGERGVPLIDCRTTVSADDFRDVTHLLEPAAERHSACVGDRIREIAQR